MAANSKKGQNASIIWFTSKTLPLYGNKKGMQAPHPIHNEAEYRAALAALSRFFDSNPDTASQESSTTKH